MSSLSSFFSSSIQSPLLVYASKDDVLCLTFLTSSCSLLDSNNSMTNRIGLCTYIYISPLYNRPVLISLSLSLCVSMQVDTQKAFYHSLNRLLWLFLQIPHNPLPNMSGDPFDGTHTRPNMSREPFGGTHTRPNISG